MGVGSCSDSAITRPARALGSSAICTAQRRDRGRLARCLVLFAAFSLATGWSQLALAQNAIAVENALPGNPPSQWDISGAGDASIQGFATDISVNRGETVRFKIDTPATNYRLDIYRLGYYGGNGARLVATVQPSAALPQNQPACLSDPTTGLVDCGNWAVSASWTVPANATSGIYIAKLVREDPENGRASHIAFVVRDDDGGSDILFQTSDTTWQAYNAYGGNSLYTGQPAGRAYKVSYNRPFTTRCCSCPAGEPESWLFNAEYPMVRWLERNGYDVSYTTGVDADRRGAEMLEHGVYMTVGHDEYWSGGQRANVEAARDAGVHLAFLSRQRGVLEDPLGIEHRRLRHAVPHTRLLQGDPRQRQDRSAARRVDGNLARPALRPARRRPARERAQRTHLHRERPPQRHSRGAGGGRQDALLAQHQHRDARAGRHGRTADGRSRLRVGRGSRQRLPPARAGPPVDDHGIRRLAPPGLRLDATQPERRRTI